MYFFTFVAAFLLTRRLLKLMQSSPYFPKWKNLLNILSLILVGMFFAVSGIDEPAREILTSLMLLALVVYFNREPDFQPYRPFIMASVPLIVVGLLDSFSQLIFPSFYKSWDSYLTYGTLAAFVWIFARWAGSKKQEEELRIVNERKNLLETLVAERTAELTKQKDELQEALKALQATQDQLIQQEKLASLGELTAGIAHEIQNPLNFVNNFSEVSSELVAELQEGPLQHLPEEEKVYAAEIIDDLTQNLGKITFHGKRADSIVKGMLQHSRTSTGQKEPADLNALADEYMRLSYHGLRAKDKSFNAKLVTDFDASLPQLNVIPQDLGRVLLNLFNNAFYSVHQKKLTQPNGYEPQVQASTKWRGNGVELRIRDNGNGIPEAIRNKILQPFFTTKPTGQGTGLGLSLSYDIITKGHGGEIRIETQEGEFAEFIITIPATQAKAA